MIPTTRNPPREGTVVADVQAPAVVAPKPIYLWIAQGLFVLQAVGLTVVAGMIFPSTPAFGALASIGVTLYVVVIIGIQRRRPWARVAAVLALAVLWLTLGIRYVLTDSPSTATPALSGLLMLLAVPLLFGDSVRSYFRQPPAA